jgi:hypothetical protein
LLLRASVVGVFDIPVVFASSIRQLVDQEKYRMSQLLLVILSGALRTGLTEALGYTEGKQIIASTTRLFSRTQSIIKTSRRGPFLNSICTNICLESTQILRKRPHI